MDDNTRNLLKSIKDETARISQKHKPLIDKLVSLGYIEHRDGSWVVTEIGNSHLGWILDEWGLIMAKTAELTVQTSQGFEDIIATLHDSGICEFSKPINQEDVQMCIDHVNICLDDRNGSIFEMVWFEDVSQDLIDNEE